MRMIKVGDKYLGLVASQRDAIRFDTNADVARVIAASITEGAEHVEGVSALGLTGARVVKLKTRADATGESMRGLASDVLDANAGADLGEAMNGQDNGGSDPQS